MRSKNILLLLILGLSLDHDLIAADSPAPVEPTPEQKIQALSQLLEYSPSNAGALRERGYQYARLGQEAKARADFEHALTLQPNFWQVHWSYGWAMFDLGHYQEALDHWQKWYQSEPAKKIPEDHSTINYTLALGYWSVGKKMEAFSYWERALKSQPDYWSTREQILNRTNFWIKPERDKLLELFNAWQLRNSTNPKP